MDAALQEQHRSSVSFVAGRHPMMELALLYHRLLDPMSEQGQPLSFLEMPFLIQLYLDLPTLEYLVVRKCTQVGLTTATLVFALMQALRGRKHAVVLPDEDFVRSFIQDEVDPMIHRAPFYRELVRSAQRHNRKAPDNTSLKQIGRGSWRFVGSRKPSKLRSFAVDSILVDEVDECEQAWLDMVHDRVLASPAPQKFWLSNPRLGEKGISKMFEGTDARQWFQRCPRCGHRQRVDWFEHIVRRDDAGRWIPRDTERAAGLTEAIERPEVCQDLRPLCIRCHQPWDRTAEGGCWVAEHPGRSRRGYTIAQMDHLGRRLWPLFRRWLSAQASEMDLVLFYGSVLGIAYEPRGGKLTDTDLRNALNQTPIDYAGGELYRDLLIVAGVDVGAVFHVIISSMELRLSDPSDPNSKKVYVRRAVWVGSLPSWEAVSDRFRAYRVNLAVVDAQPEGHGAKAFRDHHNRNTATQVWLWRHQDATRTTIGDYGLTPHAATFEAITDKHQMLDVTTADIRQGRCEFPPDVTTVLGFTAQMKADVRKLVTDTRGNERYRWDRGTSRNDYRMADAYTRVAADLVQMGVQWSSVSI